MKIVLTGGGSGGHFYPIISVAQSLNEIATQERIATLDLLYISTEPYDEGLLFDNNISRLNIYLKVARPESQKNKISEIKLFSSDLAIFAKKQANSFEESIDLVCEALRKQIIKNKKK